MAWSNIALLILKDRYRSALCGSLMFTPIIVLLQFGITTSSEIKVVYYSVKYNPLLDVVYLLHPPPSFNPLVLARLSPAPECNTVSRRRLLGYALRRPRAERDETNAWRGGGRGEGVFIMHCCHIGRGRRDTTPTLESTGAFELAEVKGS